MIWQDLVISIGQFGFAIAMIPSITSKQKPALFSSLFTAIGLTVFGVCFLTLELWLSVIGVWSAALMWWILVIQKVK